MRLADAYTSKAVALVDRTNASNRIPYLGAGLFPPKKKMGLDLKWIKTSKGLPVSLSPSAFDTVSTIRSREGFVQDETEMAFFKESMIVKETDEQEIMRVESADDPYAIEVLRSVYDDANTLIEGARVVPERMIMQLLTPANGHPGISISFNGASYVYNYDPDNSYATNNFASLSGQSAWSDTTNADPVADVQTGKTAVEDLTGSTPRYMIVSRQTMNYLLNNAKVRNYVLAQNAVATVVMTDERVKEVFRTQLGIEIIVYTKKYRDESGTVQKFFPDGFATLIPEGALGNTYRGVTPEERTGVQNPSADVTVLEDGIAVSVTVTDDPVHTKTTVSEIVLPSFERMDECFTIKAY